MKWKNAWLCVTTNDKKVSQLIGSGAMVWVCPLLFLILLCWVATSLLGLHFPVHWIRLWYFSKNIVSLWQIAISHISKLTFPPNPKWSSKRIERKDEQKRKNNFSRISKQTIRPFFFCFFCRQIRAFCFWISFWLVPTLLFCTIKWMQSSCVF